MKTSQKSNEKSKKNSKENLGGSYKFKMAAKYKKPKKEEECNIIFGVIQDSFSRKLYEFTLYCYNINSETAAQIINGIKIN
tara:strand:- start:7 stop:249 length:243 start_codon:yes stop_codon:yes gene_type:complete